MFSLNEQMAVLVELNVYVFVDMVMMAVLDSGVSFGMVSLLMRRRDIVFVEVRMVWMYFWVVWWRRMMNLCPI